MFDFRNEMEVIVVAEFTLADGNPITVNLQHVGSFQPADDGTLLIFVDGRHESVQESYDVVAETLNPERQAGC